MKHLHCNSIYTFLFICLFVVSSSDNRLLNKEETWVVEGKKQNEVFPKDEEFEEIEGPEPTAAKKKRNANGNALYRHCLLYTSRCV